jgi:DNA repair protein RadA/Sms
LARTAGSGNVIIPTSDLDFVMARTKTVYVCSDCGAHSVKWQGQCPDCDAWNSLAQVNLGTSSGAAGSGVSISSIAALGDDLTERYPSGFEEFDRVLGGGIVPGSVILLGGDPGVGKSTLLQQVAGHLPPELKCCYASGEESLRQIGQRAHRLGLANKRLALLADTSLDNVLQQAISSGTKVLVVDSIQTLTSAQVSSSPGSVSQLRECVGRLVQFAKQNEVALFLIGHVTKEGAIAGPRVVEHMVDTVLYFENDPASRYSIVRSVKNRFGASNEMGVFAMNEKGFREVRNPSAIFLTRDEQDVSGSLVTVAWEGSRPLLVEIQALVADCQGNYPRRLAQGIEQNRLALLLAVLQRHGDLTMVSEDVFINVVGGLRIAEPSADLPTLLAIVSSYRDKPCSQQLISFGEVGLAGEVRPIRFGAERIEAAAKQGFTTAIVPKLNMPKKAPPGMEIIGVSRLSEALHAAFD